MLNISPVSVAPQIDKSKYKAFDMLKYGANRHLLPKVFFVVFLVFIIVMFLPWTQNIRSTGKVTTLNPYDKPQTIQPLIGGRIQDWYVTEGDIVAIGDTIAILTEAKAEYLDPNLLNNTKLQQEAKLSSASAYGTKKKALADQLVSFKALQDSKLQQLAIKNRQIDIEINSMNQELIAAQTLSENANNQLLRMEEMYKKGIKSLTDLETKKLSLRDAEAKLLLAQNKLTKLNNDKLNVIQERTLAIAEYNQKVSKIESDIQSAESLRYTSIGEANKLESKFNQIQQRQESFAILSPIAGRITKILKNGIGEFVKEQDALATIVPLAYQGAVELFVEPVDMPLIQVGKNVRLQFDGWPAIIFSGWPNNSFGTYDGKVYAIDNDISQNGKYRILVTESNLEKPWPDLIRLGSGARGLLLLNDVRVYYEIWRQLNGFPPDFYQPDDTKDVKTKAPLRKIK